MEYLYLLVYFLYALVASNLLGVIATVITYILLYVTGFGPRKSIPYACFFLAGVIVAKFQWHIVFDEDRSGLIQYYFEAILSVPIVSIIGLLFSLRYLAVDRLLSMIITMTLLLALLQFLAEGTNIPYIVLNYYARIYAITAVLLPFVSLSWNWHTQRCNTIKDRQTK